MTVNFLPERLNDEKPEDGLSCQGVLITLEEIAVLLDTTRKLASESMDADLQVCRSLALAIELCVEKGQMLLDRAVTQLPCRSL